NSILWNGHSVQTYAYDLESTQRVSCHRYLNSSYLKNNDSPIQVMSRPDRLDIDLNIGIDVNRGPYADIHLGAHWENQSTEANSRDSESNQEISNSDPDNQDHDYQ